MSGNHYSVRLFDVIISTGIYILILVIPLIFFPLSYERYTLPKETIFQLITFLLAIFTLSKSYFFGKLYFPKTSMNLPIIAFILISGLSAIKAINTYDASLDLLHLITGVLLFFIILANARIMPSIDHIANISVFCGTLISILGIYQYAEGGIAWIYEALSPASTFGHRNFAATYIIMIIPMALFKFILSKEKKTDYIYLLTFNIMLTYLIFTLCRAAWLGVIAGTLFILMLWIYIKYIQSNKILQNNTVFTKQKLFYLSFSAFTVIVLTLIPISSGVDKKKIFDISGGSGKNRIVFWKNTSVMIKDNPFLGVGPGNFKINYPKYWRAVVPDTEASERILMPHPHNDFIEIMAETGILGFAAFLILLFTIAKTSLSTIKKHTELKDILAILTLLYAIVNLLGRASLGFPLKLPTTSMLFWCFCGLIGVEYLKKHNKSETSKYRNIKRKTIFSLLIIFVVFFVYLSKELYLKIVADRYFSNALAYSEKNLPNMARREIIKVTRLTPDYYNGQIIAAGLNTTLKNYQEAEKQALKALQLRPYTPYALDMLGFICMETGAHNKSIHYFRQAIALKPDFIGPHYRLGMLFLKLGDAKKALREFKTILEFQPDHKDARRMIKELGE